MDGGNNCLAMPLKLYFGLRVHGTKFTPCVKLAEAYMQCTLPPLKNSIYYSLSLPKAKNLQMVHDVLLINMPFGQYG